ncbi:MAG: DNA repair protein RadC [Akkermansiaceae bacterium]|nr:DNA repair protein RadC [Akkermansiaceae bacterium]
MVAHALPPESRPRERLIRSGPRVLSEVELVALVLGHGDRQAPASVLAERIVRWSRGSLVRLAGAEVEALTSIPGVGPARAARIVAALELGRRIVSAPDQPDVPISGPGDVWRLMRGDLECLGHEEFHVVLMNAQNAPIGRRQVTRGILDASLIHPREVFRSAILNNAASLVLVHNHPSGNPEPSAEDMRVTTLLAQAGKALGIPVVDHVIIGAGRFVSLAGRGELGADGAAPWF